MHVFCDNRRIDLLGKAARGLFLAGVAGIAVKIGIGETLLGLSAVLLVVWLAIERRLPAWPRTVWGGMAFLAVAALSCVVQPDLPRGWKGLTRPLWLFVIPVAGTFLRGHIDRWTLLRAFAVGCSVLALVVLIDNPIDACRALHKTGSRLPDYRAALIDVGSMTDGQMLMLGLIATTGTILGARRAGQRTVVWWIMLGLQALAFVINFKRGSWFCGVGLLVVFLAVERHWKSLALLALLIGMAMLFPGVRERLSGLKSELDSGKGGRLTMWTQALPGLAKDHPWLGVGYKQLTNAAMRRYAPRVEPQRNHLHSNLAQVLAETGWVGLAVYMAWMLQLLGEAAWGVFRERRADSRRGLAARVLFFVLLGLLGNGLVEYNFGDTELVIVLGVTAAALVARDTPGRDLAERLRDVPCCVSRSF